MLCLALGLMNAPSLHAWRHARADLAQGRCIGRTDLRLDPRRAKRLAHRMRTFARQNALPRIVITSPLGRCRAVGCWLARWGWQHHIDDSLIELDFGHWDGLAWSSVPPEEIDAWCLDFARATPGGGESVGTLLERVLAFDPGDARMVVTHGGWLSAAIWLSRHPGVQPCSETWPEAPKTGQRVDLAWIGRSS